jgi:methionyl-tRNA formyltransferase
MDVCYFGRGKVADRCLELLVAMPVTILPQVMSHEADLWVSVHWPHIFTHPQLALPKLGAVNVHNSYLPWNRGAHATTWAIVDRTPAGATMHWIDEGIDTGDIIYQERLEVEPYETADQLYKRTADAEVRVFKTGMELLLAGNYRRYPQPQGGTLHYKKDFDRLVRAMTTSDCKVVREV